MATELGALSIRTCAKAMDMPDITDHIVTNISNPKYTKTTRGGWSMNQFPSNESSQSDFLKEYNQIREKFLILDRKSLIKLLKHSKVILCDDVYAK